MNVKKLLSALLIFLFANHIIAAPVFPAGFSQVKIASISEATAMAFAPDGRIFVGQRDGTIKIIKNGVLLGTPFLKLTTDQNGERGVSGITFDPNFNSNHYIYIYYTATTPTIHNRLSRFTANGDLVVAGSEFTLLDAEPLQAIYHNGGGLLFGKDGKLYLSMGEDNKPSNSQSMTTYKGKLLRMNSDGSAPTDNPYYSSSNPITRLIWCMGLRNPYTMAKHPVTGRLFVNNVGADDYEEVHDGTTSGKNFGWPYVEGYGSDPTYTNPIFAYPHDATGQHGCAITGGAFFNPTTTNYPSQYAGKYFYQEFCNGWIWYFTPGTTSASNNTVFATGLTTQNLALQVGPDGNLYYLNRKDSYAGVYKIIYNNNNPPAITQQPASVSVPAGQSASFSVSATGALPLTYQWKKNGTNISGATSATYTIPSATASHAGQYTVQVSNSYGSVTSNAATLTVTTANNRPVAAIFSPATPAYFRAGDVINFAGNATDQEDGTLPASVFQWSVEFHHNNNHFHPGQSIPSGVKTGSFTTSTTDHSSANVFYRLKLIVTDSQGQKDTAWVDIHPITSTITINSQPAGLQITFDSQPFPAPHSSLTVEGLYIPIGAMSPQNYNGKTYVFHHWTSGGNANPRTIKVGAGDSTYTAVFVESTTTTCTASGTISRELWSNVTGTRIVSIPLSTTPSSTGQISIFETPQNFADNYGQRIRGYICPPVSGNYIFWISSDDHSELWLSTNNNPANKVMIASVSGYTAPREWTKYPSQKSVAINLTAGVRYYIEALHKEGSQGDNFAVGWQLPNGTQERPIPGTRLSPFTTTSTGTTPVVSITSPANGTTFSNPSNINITATASSTGGTISKVEFFNGTTKLGEDLTSPYSYLWNNVTTGNYVLKAIATNNTGQTKTSANVNITVAACSTPIVKASGPLTMCSGTVTLSTTYIAGNMYQWKKDGVDINGATNYYYTANTTGDYQVKVIQGSCISWSAPVRVRIQSGLQATITPGGPTTFCQGGNVKLYANTCSGYTYQWKKNGAYIAGATASTYTATTSGSYQLQTTLNGVSAWSALVNVTVNTCRESEEEEQLEEITNEETATEPLVIDEAPVNFQMKVYPNPTSGLFTLQLNMPSNANEKVTMRVVNMLGQEVFKKDFEGRSDYLQETVELDNTLETGIYTLQVIMGSKSENTSIVLSR